jgi:hypothetical protein
VGTTFCIIVEEAEKYIVVVEYDFHRVSLSVGMFLSHSDSLDRLFVDKDTVFL